MASTGIIQGRVSFSGARPVVPPVHMGSDETCVEIAGLNAPNDTIVIANDGSIANTFVYVKAGLDPAYTFDTPTTPVVLDQRDCRFLPHVLGVRVGQPVEITNSDPTVHTVHTIARLNPEQNRRQPVQGMLETRTFQIPEVMVKVICDRHHWMQAYIGVMAHPFFAVTGANGRFALAGLPAGTYTLEAWHEKFGTLDAEVTVTARTTQTVSFTFSSRQ